MIAKAPILLVLALAGQADDAPLSLTDLPAYRGALEAGGPAERVAFLDLWEHPEAYRGRRVEVAGRVERRFRQPAVGTFPPLTEAWIVAPKDNPICLVYPTPSADDPARPGAEVRFAGTYLRRIRYAGGDADRLAPLLVGPGPPSVTTAAGPRPGRPWRWSTTDWMVGLGVATLCVAALAATAFRRTARPIVPGPEPEFLPPGAEPRGADDDAPPPA